MYARLTNNYVCMPNQQSCMHAWPTIMYARLTNNHVCTPNQQSCMHASPTITSVWPTQPKLRVMSSGQYRGPHEYMHRWVFTVTYQLYSHRVWNATHISDTTRKHVSVPNRSLCVFNDNRLLDCRSWHQWRYARTATVKAFYNANSE